MRSLTIADAGLLHFPLIVMLGALVLAIGLASVKESLDKTAGIILLAACPLFVIGLLH